MHRILSCDSIVFRGLKQNRLALRCVDSTVFNSIRHEETSDVRTRSSV